MSLVDRPRERLSNERLIRVLRQAGRPLKTGELGELLHFPMTPASLAGKLSKLAGYGKIDRTYYRQLKPHRRGCFWSAS